MATPAVVVAFWTMLFGFLPVWFQAVVFVLLWLVLVVIVLRIVKMVLDAIPFL